ncbi:DUF4831 family protein [uncultured Alistipes sp.]|uniref:DUF4831 family protein n=1 Tax=uncultured Alistipes sp. TaxID=538949 RepID=UPI0026054C41|nr:DUF4831 family protein [uncultured Alistipes sp.]
MKKIWWILPLFFAGAATAQNLEMTRLGTYVENGQTVVETAETVLAVDITVSCEKVVSGPYARYAQRYLGLRAALSDKTVYTITDASVALMPGERYPVAGPIAPATARIESYAAHDAEFARLPIDRFYMDEQDLQSAAANAAAMIFSIRKHRLDLIDGEAGENVFGAGLPAALDRLDRMEQELLEMFIGRRMVTTETQRFRVVPAEGKYQQIICRFSPDAGLLPTDDLTGDLVLVQYEPQNPALDEPGVKAGSNTASYRIASMTRCSVIAAGQERDAEVLPVFQFGQTVALPQAKK